MLDHLLCFMHHCSFNHAICVTTQKISQTNRTYQHHRNQIYIIFYPRNKYFNFAYICFLVLPPTKKVVQKDQRKNKAIYTYSVFLRYIRTSIRLEIHNTKKPKRQYQQKNRGKLLLVGVLTWNYRKLCFSPKFYPWEIRLNDFTLGGIHGLVQSRKNI